MAVLQRVLTPMWLGPKNDKNITIEFNDKKHENANEK